MNKDPMKYPLYHADKNGNISKIQPREEATLAIFIDFVEKESQRMYDYRSGLPRKDTPQVSCLIFMREFLKHDHKLIINELEESKINIEAEERLRGEHFPEQYHEWQGFNSGIKYSISVINKLMK